MNPWLSRAATILTWVASVIYVGSRIARDWTPHDDGLLAQSAERMLAGQLPHRDFADAYTGLLTAYHAVAFALGGHSLLTLRLALLVAFALWVPAFYAVALRFLPPLGAALATAVGVVWSVPNYSASMPSWYNLFLTTAGTLAVIRYLETRSRRWLIGAGVCAGLSVLVKIVGVYFIIATVVFLYWRRLDASAERRGDGPAGRSRRGVRAGLAVAAATAVVLGLLVLVGRDLNEGTVLQLVVPVVAVSVVLAAAGVRSRAVPWKTLGMEILAFGLGITGPTILFLIPYVTTHSVGSLITGVFVSPLSRLASATLAPPGLRDAARALPIVVGLCVAAASRGTTRRVVVWSAAPLMAAVLALSIYGSVYTSIIDAVRSTVPIAACVAAVLLVRERRPAAPSIDRQRAAIVVFAAVFFSLIQFPFAATVYFCYVAPFALLAVIAVLAGSSRRVPSVVGGTLLAFLLCFAVWHMNREAYHTLASGSEAKPNALLAIPRGGVRVSREDSATYTRLVRVVRAHASGGYMFCTPDCPETYFLAGLRNPTRTTYEFLNDPPRDAPHTLSLIDAHRVTVVAVNRQFRFSAIDPALIHALGRQFPNSTRVGYFTVRWR